MISIRDEWLPISRERRVGNRQNESKKEEEVNAPSRNSSLAPPDLTDGANDRGLALFVGIMILQSVLLKHVPRLRHLVGGFLNALGDALLCGCRSSPAPGQGVALPKLETKLHHHPPSRVIGGYHNERAVSSTRVPILGRVHH
jgi:hypothetical protein